MINTFNRQIVLAKRPNGAPRLDDFQLIDGAMLVAREGELLLQNLWLSLDPYMRGRMNDTRDSYAPPFELGAPPGGSTVARVVASKRDDFAEGDLVVVGDGGWQSFVVSDGRGLRRLQQDVAQPSQVLGVLGMTGFTAWWGLTVIGEPHAGETLLVSAAAGAVGSVVGQIGRIVGCRVVGIAGGAAKCRHVVDHLGFDTCLDYHDPDFAGELARATPDGVDIYFENVGGSIREAVWHRLKDHARVPLCGLVSGYNGVAEDIGGGIHPLLMSLIVRRIRLQGYLISDHLDLFATFEAQMQEWLDAGQLRASETIVEGLDQAPTAFIGLFDGKNIGKSLVKVAD